MSEQTRLSIVLRLMLSSYQERITRQLHRLGGSYDWNRAAFTMSPVRILYSTQICRRTHLLSQNMTKAVIENFCRLHEDGVIYRANRLVNWCVQLNTTLSNLEVRYPRLLLNLSLTMQTGGPERVDRPNTAERAWI